MDTERDEAPGWIPRLLVLVTGWCARRPWCVVAFVLATCSLSIYGVLFHLTCQTQRSDLISPHKDFFQRWQQYLAEFGDDDDMVVVVKGRHQQAMIAALEDVAGAIGRQPELFDRLFYQVDLRPLASRALLFLRAEEIRAIQENVRNMDLLLEPPVVSYLDPWIGWKSLTLVKLLQEGQNRLATIDPARPPQSGVPLRPGDEQFFGQLGAVCRGVSQVLHDAAAYQSPWQSLIRDNTSPRDQLSEPQYFLSGDGTLAFLLVRPVKDRASFTSAQSSVEALRAIIALVAPRFPDLQIGLTGLPVLENDEMVASRQDANLASILALVGVALLYLIVYRGLRYPLMTVASLVVGTVWALGWLTLTVGHLNILSSAFAVMLIGMGDYGVLWVTRFTQERQSGADLSAATRRTALSVGPGILTAAVTTALAFFATMLADFKAIAELGWIAGCGILLCALSCFLVMPCLLALFDRRYETAAKTAAKAQPGKTQPGKTGPIVCIGDAPHKSPDWLPWLARHPRCVVAASLALTLALGFWAWQVRYDHNLLNMQARNLDSVQWEQTLIDRTAGASWHAVSYTNTPEEALALKARYEQLPGVSRVVEVASLVPTDQGRKLEMLGDLQHRLRRLPDRGATIPHAPPSVARVRELAVQLHKTLTFWRREQLPPVLLALRDNALELASRLSMPSDVTEVTRRLLAFEENMTRDLADDLHRLRDMSSPQAIAVDDLPQCLRERYLGKSGKWLLRVFGKDCLWDYGPLADFCDQVRTVDPESAGKPFNTLEGLRAMKSGFLWAGLYAFIAMVLVLLADFRNVKHTAIALAPLAMGMIMALGVMTLCGWTLNPANMIALPLILGVGADNGVHVLHDYRSRARGRRYRLSAVIGRGISVAALTTILGFGTLMLGQHRGVASLGLILTLGVTCCMLTALIFLPALLQVLSVRGPRRVIMLAADERQQAA